MPRQLDEIKNDFERAVFLAVYHSRAQRLQRMRAAFIIVLVHFLRGAIIGFPIYLIFLALAFSPLAGQHPWYLTILLPGVIGWTWVLIKGARADYQRLVAGRIHEQPFSHHLLLDL